MISILIPFIRTLRSPPNHFLKASSPETITLEFRISTYKFGGWETIFSLQQLASVNGVSWDMTRTDALKFSLLAYSAFVFWYHLEKDMVELTCWKKRYKDSRVQSSQLSLPKPIEPWKCGQGKSTAS